MQALLSTGGRAHVALHLQQLCRRASPAGSGRSGGPPARWRCRCHSPRCPGTASPTGSPAAPTAAPGTTRSCGHRRDTSVCQAGPGGWGQLHPGFGLCWLHQGHSPEPAWGTPGETSLSPGERSEWDLRDSLGEGNLCRDQCKPCPKAMKCKLNAVQLDSGSLGGCRLHNLYGQPTLDLHPKRYLWISTSDFYFSLLCNFWNALRYQWY